MVSEKGRGLHARAEDAREHKQDMLLSLNLLNEAINAYLSDGDTRGASEAVQSSSSAYKHLYQSTGNGAYLILALGASETGVKLAESTEDTSGLSMAYRGHAKILQEKRDWKGSAEFFSKAIVAFDNNPPPENNRPAVRSDMKAHLAFAQYMTGDKSALGLMDEAIAELASNAGEDKYNRDVWLSGAHMRAAAMLYADDPATAKTHLDKAKEIVEANPELILRAKQLEELTSKLAF